MNDQDRSPRLNRGRERGFFELYGADPERAAAIVFGRRTRLDRRGFLKGAGLASLGAALGAIVPFARHLPSWLVPVAFGAETDWVLHLSGAGLTVLNDRPINAETPAHLLDDNITPSSLHFVRNNGLMPEHVDSSEWRLNVDGDVIRPTTFSIRDLRRNFPLVKAALLLECGGNGRAGYNPPARGNQWTTGAVANSYWTGVRYRDVLNAVGIKPVQNHRAHHRARLAQPTRQGRCAAFAFCELQPHRAQDSTQRRRGHPRRKTHRRERHPVLHGDSERKEAETHPIFHAREKRRSGINCDHQGTTSAVHPSGIFGVRRGGVGVWKIKIARRPRDADELEENFE